MKIIKTAALSLSLFLVACQGLQGERQGDYYFSPAGAYILDLGINTFRGEVVLDERCDRNGGSTTFWDCLLYTSPSPRDRQKSRMPSSA